MAIIKRLGKISKANWGKGTITHKDKEVDNLRLKVLWNGETDIYFGVMGEQADLLRWANRVGAETVTKADIIAVRDAESPPTRICDMGYEHPHVKEEIDDTL